MNDLKIDPSLLYEDVDNQESLSSKYGFDLFKPKANTLKEQSISKELFTTNQKFAEKQTVELFTSEQKQIVTNNKEVEAGGLFFNLIFLVILIELSYGTLIFIKQKRE